VTNKLLLKKQAISAVLSSARLHFLHKKFIMDVKKVEFENSSNEVSSVANRNENMKDKEEKGTHCNNRN